MTNMNPPVVEPCASFVTFANVLCAVATAEGLTDGVRSNMQSAVVRCASLCSGQGVHAAVSVQSIARVLKKLTPAKLGFANPNSFAAFQSNLRRALRIAGITVMPGRHQVPLTGDWANLKERTDASAPWLWPATSRFVHYLSERGVGGDQVGELVFSQFANDLRTTCLGSKVDKVVRNTARAWKQAQAAIPGWPHATLGCQPRKSDAPLLPWTAFPPSLEEDARRFLERDQDLFSLGAQVADNEEITDTEQRPLRAATRSNYLAGLQRIASNLVALGIPAGDLQLLADLVELPRVRAVLRHVSNRTRRTQGGHVMFLALLLYMVARDHVGVTGSKLATLRKWFKKTRPDTIGMSDRTLGRFTQFDDPAMLDRLVRLPKQLIAQADKAAAPDTSSAKRARLALYLALLLETCARSGNIVGLSLETHIVSSGNGKGKRTFAVIPAHEVKNGQEIRAELSPATAHMLRHYVDRYRSLHCAQPSSWLFPRRDGTHWSTTQACTDLKDIAARRIGVDVTPHLIRALAGKIILDARPGAIGTVQQLLGHKQLDTTLRFYARLDPQNARAEYQRLLEGRRRGGRA